MKHPARLLFLKTNISENSRHTRFEEIEFWLMFGENVHRDTQRHPQEPLWRLSGDSQECHQEPNQPWSKNLIKPCCFFYESDATDHFCRRMAKLTYTEYQNRALHTKVVRVFCGRVQPGSKARISNTARTPTDKSAQGMLLYQLNMITHLTAEASFPQSVTDKHTQ